MREIKTAKELGYKGRGKFGWTACEECGKKRWVALCGRRPVSKRCGHCRRGFQYGERHHSWKGGRLRMRDGYVLIRVYPDDFFYPMAMKSGYVREHRLVMAKHLGRNLHIWEIVHHKNGIKDDNRIENLQLVTDDRHKQISIMGERIATLEKRITLLEAENAALISNLKNIREEEIEGVD